MRNRHRFSYIEGMRFWRPAVLAAALAAAALLAANPAAAQPPREESFTPRAAIGLPNGQKLTRFDISWVDPRLGEYFLADSTNKTIDVFDTKNNRVVTQLTGNFAGVGPTFDTGGPNGVLTVDHRYVWVGDYGNGSNGGTGGLVKVVDLTNGSLVATIATGGVARADELCYDATDHVILIANPGELLPSSGGTGPFVTFINSQTYQVQGRIFMNGQNGAPLATNGIEQCQWVRRNDKFYINIPEVNGPGTDAAPGAVLEIDPTAMTITNTFSIPLGECEGPQGMAVGPFPQLLIGCNDPLKDVPNSVTIDYRNGTVINTFPGEDGPDEVWYNPGDGHYFLAESGGANPQHLGIIDAAIAQALNIGREDASQTIGVKGGGAAHSVAADPGTRKVFVPVPSNAGAGVCGSVGGDDSAGCIAVYKAGHGTSEGE
jgi:hypothetical protein